MNRAGRRNRREVVVHVARVAAEGCEMRTLSPARPQPLPPTSGEEARVFLQERLAFLGLA